MLTLAGVLRSMAGVGIPHTTLCHMLTTEGGSLGPGQLRLSQDFPACSCQYPLISRLRVLALVMCGMAGGREGPPCYDQHHSTVVLCSVVQQLCICMVHGLGWIGSPCILNWGPRSHTHAWPFWLKRVCVRAVGSPWLLLLFSLWGCRFPHLALELFAGDRISLFPYDACQGGPGRVELLAYGRRFAENLRHLPGRAWQGRAPAYGRRMVHHHGRSRDLHGLRPKAMVRPPHKLGPTSQGQTAARPHREVEPALPSASPLLARAPGLVEQLWRREGVEALTDLAFLYRDGAALSAELEVHIPGISTADVKQALAIWAEARTLVPAANRAVAVQVTAARPRAATPCSIAASSVNVGGTKRVRSRGVDVEGCTAAGDSIPWDESQVGAHGIACGSVPETPAGGGINANALKGPPGTIDRQHPVFRQVYGVYCDLGSRGLKWIENSSGYEDLHEVLFHRSLRDASIKRLAAALSLMRRWCRWLIQQGHRGREEDASPTSPDPLLLGSFLLEVASGGPTAASGAWALLEWWRTAIGVPFPTTAPLVSSFRWVQAGHLRVPRWNSPCGCS